MTNSALPVKEILSKAVTSPFKYWLPLLKQCWPLLVSLSMAYAFFVIQDGTGDIITSLFEEENPAGSILVLILIPISVFITLVMSIIRCHRIFILEGADNINPLSFTGKEIRYIGWSILFMIITWISLMILMFALNPIKENLPEDSIIFTVILSMIIIPIQFFIAQYSLLLPASAMGEKELGLEWASDLTKGNKIRIFLLIGVIPLLTPYITDILPDIDNIILDFISLIAFLIIILIELCILSLCYDFLIKNKNKIQDQSNNQNISPEISEPLSN